jgi:hypothetical protein
LLGPDAAWNGAADAVALTPGATVTVRLPLAGGIDPVPARALFKQVAGIGIRIEGGGVTWSGNVAMDKVRVEGVQGPTAEDTGALPVGTFGGFQGTHGENRELPTRNGFLTFTADATVQGHALVWPRLGANGGDFTVGQAWFDGALPSPSQATLGFRDWVTLEAQQPLTGGGTARALLSRAFPAVRYTSDAGSFTWSTSAQELTLVENGQITTHDLAGFIDLSAMSEPWAVLWTTNDPVPVLITFQHRPDSAQGGSGATFNFSGAMDSAQVMPLYGLSRAGWHLDDAIVQARALVPVLAAFPVGLRESFSIDEASQKVSITDSFVYETIADDWGTQATPVAAVPPAVYWAGKNGFPVTWAAAPVETTTATFYGPFAYQAGATASFTLPLPAAISREPVSLRVNNSAATAPIRAEMERMLSSDVPSVPSSAWLGNDLSDAQFLCDAWRTLAPGSAARAKAQTSGPELAESPFLS